MTVDSHVSAPRALPLEHIRLPTELEPLQEALGRLHCSAIALQVEEDGSGQMHVILSQGRPRWALPADQKLPMWPLVSWRPYRLSSRIAWWAVLVAARARLLERIPRVVRVSAHGSRPGQYAKTLNGDRIAAIYIGTVSATHSCTVFCEAPAGTAERPSKFVIRIPLNATAERAVAKEFALLEQLRLAVPGVAPEPVDMCRESGVSRVSYVEGRTVSTRFSQAVMDFLLRLRRPDPPTALGVATNRLMREAKGLNVSRESLQRLGSRLSSLAPDQTLPCVWSHGDFTPFNLRKCPDGRIRAVDWEHGTAHGIPLYDLVTFYFMQDALFGSRKSRTHSFRRQALRYLDSMRIRRELFRPLLEVCLWKAWLAAVERGDESYANSDFEPIEALSRMGGNSQ